jgi:hypothetical protein
MTEYSGPFYFETGGSGDGWDETEWMAMTADWWKDGILRYNNRCKVIEATPAAMSVLVSVGKAMVNGAWYKNDAAKTITITAADATNPRIDRIVLRRTFNSPTSAVVAAVLTGTAAASPSAPALTQDATTWEISLAQVAVAAGATSIQQANITDERDSTYCGFTGPIQIGQMYINTSGDLDASSNKIVNLTDCTAAQDAATKSYVDTTIASATAAATSSYKKYCRAATSGANITIATALNNGDTLDGVTLATGDRVLVKDQTDRSQNGIYVVAASPARATDADSADELYGLHVFVTNGTNNAGTEWVLPAKTITVGSTGIDVSYNGMVGGVPPMYNGYTVGNDTTRGVNNWPYGTVDVGDAGYYPDASGNLGIVPQPPGSTSTARITRITIPAMIYHSLGSASDARNNYVSVSLIVNGTKVTASTQSISGLTLDALWHPYVLSFTPATTGYDCKPGDKIGLHIRGHPDGYNSTFRILPGWCVQGEITP